MDLAQLRSDMAVLLEPAGITRVFPVIVDSINGPTAIVYPDGFQYHDTFDRGENPKLIVQLLTPATSNVAGQNAIDGWIGAGEGTSAVDAIEEDPRFRVEEMRNYGVVTFQDGGSRYYSAELIVDVLA